ncbi:hypothetical protein evm_014183 [Chilo suppressalis]|nr:hypothetical protein evm_014183 [Chilo suppressalis]
MVGVSIPFSVLLYTIDRYQYPEHWGVVIAVAWCTLICVSRVYLGMHSVLDIAAGLLLSSLLLVVLIPVVDWLDGLLLTNNFAPLIVITLSILAIVFYPDADKWTPTSLLMSLLLGYRRSLLMEKGGWAMTHHAGPVRIDAC